MPPLPADSIHARACKLKCEKNLDTTSVTGFSFGIMKESIINIKDLTDLQKIGKTFCINKLCVALKDL